METMSEISDAIARRVAENPDPVALETEIIAKCAVLAGISGFEVVNALLKDIMKASAEIQMEEKPVAND